MADGRGGQGFCLLLALTQAFLKSIAHLHQFIHLRNNPLLFYKWGKGISVALIFPTLRWAEHHPPLMPLSLHTFS
jgi:hypothetical protein